jgi:hypothetical protein
MKTYSILGIIIAFFLMSNSGCIKRRNEVVAGKGGQNVLLIFPQHHLVANNLIQIKSYIKYNTLDLPSNGQYDDSATGSRNSSYPDVFATFNELQPGNYYIYVTGYDTSVRQNIKGGISFSLPDNASPTSVIVPVSE